MPLVAHVIHRLDVGGLENGLVNLINRIPAERYRHAIICLTDYSDFRQRIMRSDVPVFALNKPPGNSPVTHFKLWRLLKQLRPDIVHTRNLGALEGALPAALAGVPIRIHSEHGHDVGDLGGSNRKYQWVRRALKPFVHQYIALSKDLERYLREKVHVPAARIAQLYNGVDTELFHPARGGREPLPRAGFAGPDQFVIGTVGRMQAVKDPVTLARAFVRLLHMVPEGARRLRLVMVGDGPLKEQVRSVIEEAGATDVVWLAGERDDVPRIMRGLDLFVLPSISEGVSNTVLEAMASGLPVLATRVGGNPELIEADVTGTLVPRDDAESMARAMRAYAESAGLCTSQGSDARRAVERRFGMQAMVNAYIAIYDKMLASTTRRVRSRSSASVGG
ncbi:MAG TPA: TIGR03088 family PEP-CTERM/XrtA system glycosyltransferase [Burkholderiales bacterium]